MADERPPSAFPFEYLVASAVELDPRDIVAALAGYVSIPDGGPLVSEVEVRAYIFTGVGEPAGAAPKPPAMVHGLPLYDRNRHCSKCGATGAATSFAGGDALRRTCANCGHTWAEATLDAATLDEG